MTFCNQPRHDARDIANALHGSMQALIEHFRGAPNRTESSRSETRWGRKGSLVLHLAGRRAGRWDDHEAGTGGDSLDFIRAELGCDLRAAIQWAADFLGGSAPLPQAPAARAPLPPRDDVQARREMARRLWAESLDPVGTLVETYLAGRGLALPDDVAGHVLRFHPGIAWKDETGVSTRVPAMVAAMRDIRSDEITAVHRTALTPDGMKIGKKMLGSAGGAAVKIDADAEVTHGLSVGEGIETCLAARQMGWRPVWALGSAGSVRMLPVLAGISALTLLGESDSASELACNECSERWGNAGREVMIVTPRNAGDMNDVLKEVA